MMECRYQVHPQYLEVTAAGIFNLADGKACIDEIHRLCGLHSLRKLLIDVRGVPEQLSVGARFSLADYLTAGSPQAIRVGMIATTEHVRFTKTFENTANNRGAQVLTTDSPEEALRFLELSP